MDVFTISEAAEALGLSNATIHKRIRNGLLKAERVGHFYVIHADEVERARALGKLPPGPPRADTEEARRRAERRQARKAGNSPT